MVKSVFSQVHGSVSFTANITTSLSSTKSISTIYIYILTLYSGYFGKNPGILGSMTIKICANIKLLQVYIKLLNKSVYQYFFT